MLGSACPLRRTFHASDACSAAARSRVLASITPVATRITPSLLISRTTGPDDASFFPCSTRRSFMLIGKALLRSRRRRPRRAREMAARKTRVNRRKAAKTSTH
jgi:hypothetical protein